MQNKLSVNLAQGLIEVEGEAAFVREVYSDFKDKLLEQFNGPVSGGNGMPDENPEKDLGETSPKPQASKAKKTRIRKRTATDSSGTPASKGPKYKPKIDPNLALNGLDEFYEQYVPKNNYERVLIFAEFLRTKLSIEPCSADAIYTCFQKLKHKSKVPVAFSQLIIDSRGDKAFISYESYDEITLTANGENHLYHDMERVPTE